MFLQNEKLGKVIDGEEWISFERDLGAEASPIGNVIENGSNQCCCVWQHVQAQLRMVRCTIRLQYHNLPLPLC
jgi:hypothetical protein